MSAARRPPIFLDRDGTIIIEKNYLSNPDEVFLEEGAVDGLAMLRDRGHPLIVVSNQSGIGRGMFTEQDMHRVNQRVEQILRHRGIDIMAWYVCPHLPSAGCDCRKPLPGMALAASRDWPIELSGSYVIGDKRSDLELADAIGGVGILVTSGHGLESLQWARGQGRPVVDNLRGAAEYIISLRGSST